MFIADTSRGKNRNNNNDYVEKNGSVHAYLNKWLPWIRFGPSFWIGSLWAHGLGGEDAHSQKREVLNGVIPLERESPDTAPFFFQSLLRLMRAPISPSEISE